MKIAGCVAVLVAMATQQAGAKALPYSAVVSDASCIGQKTCTLTFPAVASGARLTIDHVSCGILTSGESAFVSGVILSTVGTAKNMPGDHIAIGASLSGANGENTAAEMTLFYVSGGDTPIITVISGAGIASSSDGGCLISGTTS